MPDRPDSRRIALLEQRGSALEVAMQRRGHIKAAIARARVNGFNVPQLRVDLAHVEAEIRQLQADTLSASGSVSPSHSTH